MRPKLTTTEARQATGTRTTFRVLIASLALAVIVGVVLGLAFGWIPLPWSTTP
jgi:ABC-type nitrate/sulfonate/bicarbonate transport system permease component